MYETLKRLFQAGKLSKKALQKAVLRGFISEEQAEEIEEES